MSAGRALPDADFERARQVADAVLYEGYILYPYRPSSAKNRQRWTFGGLYPPAYSAAHGGLEASAMQSECLVRGSQAAVAIRLRFLHLCARQILTPQAAAGRADGEAVGFRPVEALRVGGRRYATWQEAVAREVDCPHLALAQLAASPEGARLPLAFPAHQAGEPIVDATGAVAGRIMRRQEALAGELMASAAEVAAGVYRLTVRVTNLTTPAPLPANAAAAAQAAPPAQALAEQMAAALLPSPAGHAAADRDEALLQAFVSTHLLLGASGGEFVSLLDPPDDCRDLAAACRNIGVYPVLAGAAGEGNLMLASPIILYDYPQIAAESAGDLFDGTEIDEILSLRILTMTDEEKQEARAADPAAAALLDRTEALSAEALMRLHGTLRNLRWPDEGA